MKQGSMIKTRNGEIYIVVRFVFYPRHAVIIKEFPNGPEFEMGFSDYELVKES